jgi:hypothetical protein
MPLLLQTSRGDALEDLMLSDNVYEKVVLNHFSLTHRT